MLRITGFPQHYAWGSHVRLPEFLGTSPSPEPLAELWFGAHELGSATTATGERLADLIATHPREYLGPSTRFMFGDRLPYLMKLIAPAAPLSLQVHPNKRQAEAGFSAEEEDGIGRSDPQRIYRDDNHKPELLYALTEFTLLAGFSVRRQVRELLDGLEVPLAYRLGRRLRLAAGRAMKPVVSWLLDPDSAPDRAEIDQFAQACSERLEAGRSPLPLLDSTVRYLAEAYPGDPGVIVAFLMNPVRLEPGEAIYLPPRTLHSYLDGFGLEVMANSDNVIRAGLTPKHIDRTQLVEVGQFDAHPPVRLAPEYPSEGIRRYYAPVEDFELSVVSLDAQTMPLLGTGPRLVICLQGSPTVMTRAGELELRRGECVFVTASEGPMLSSGTGVLAQCAVP
ncbi:mannose-6-phosphate isomerase, class I [Scrofimicrobium sp. R131]|uniref:mannose-6-phosphate isomerase n=1 Tax=Scrofimicrobium appendicitidis TaxID=3079930 RepID=A0AAU7V5J8_9ACTO